jgi:hypothetical protein
MFNEEEVRKNIRNSRRSTAAIAIEQFASRISIEILNGTPREVIMTIITNELKARGRSAILTLLDESSKQLTKAKEVAVNVNVDNIIDQSNGSLYEHISYIKELKRSPAELADEIRNITETIENAQKALTVALHYLIESRAIVKGYELLDEAAILALRV